MDGHTQKFRVALMSRHAWQEARRERIPTDMIALTYDDPDDVRPSEHDELRQIRTRWFADQGVDVVVDIEDGRVVTIWRRGQRP
jgi:hypothetical protein